MLIKRQCYSFKSKRNQIYGCDYLMLYILQVVGEWYTLVKLIRQQDLKKHCCLIFVEIRTDFPRLFFTTCVDTINQVPQNLCKINWSIAINYLPSASDTSVYCSNNWALTNICDCIFGIGKLQFCNLFMTNSS